MPRRTIEIAPHSCVASVLSSYPEENAARILVVDAQDSPKGGGQGTIHPILEIDGVQVRGLIAKIFPGATGIPDNVREIIEVIAKDAQEVADCPALATLPLFLFDGTESGQPCSGYIMRHFEGEQFSAILEDDFDDYLRIPWEARLRLCLQFTQALSVLYALTIIHADINGENILIDRDRQRIVLIDLDAGAVAKNGSAPITFGKQVPGWLAPEIIAQLAKGDGWHVDDVKMTADLWSMASGLHHLLFGCAPFFFITNGPDKEQYLARYRWPQLSGLNIQTINNSFFDDYEREFARTKEIGKLFKVSFQEGYGTPSRRITAYQWMQVIREELESGGFSATLPSVKFARAGSASGAPIIVPTARPTASGAAAAAAPALARVPVQQQPQPVVVPPPPVPVPIPRTVAAAPTGGNVAGNVVGAVFVILLVALIGFGWYKNNSPTTTGTPVVQPGQGATVTTPPPAPSDQSLQVGDLSVSSLRFFETPNGMVPRDQRSYLTQFANGVQNIGWELDLTFPQRNVQSTFQLQATWYRPDGSVMAQQPVGLDIQPGWNNSWSQLSWNDSDGAAFPPGVYRVEVSANNQSLANANFEILGEAVKNPDDEPLQLSDLTTTSLRFFETPNDMVGRDERSYSTQFASNNVRYIGWELDLSFPKRNVQSTFQLQATWYRPDGSMLAQQPLELDIQPNWNNSWSQLSWGNQAGGAFPPGSYRVEVSADSQTIANSSFRILGEVAGPVVTPPPPHSVPHPPPGYPPGVRVTQLPPGVQIFQATHKHAVGGCVGQLQLGDSLAFHSSAALGAHSFSFARAQVASIDGDGIVDAWGRKWHFTIAGMSPAQVNELLTNWRNGR